MKKDVSINTIIIDSIEVFTPVFFSWIIFIYANLFLASQLLEIRIYEIKEVTAVSLILSIISTPLFAKQLKKTDQL